MKVFHTFFVILLYFEEYFSLSTECGRRLRTVDWPSNRIIGGSDAQLGDYPWQVSIHLYIPAANNSLHVCGGTYISDQWVLTAAHCLDTGLDMKYYFVVVGVVDLESNNSTLYKKLQINRFILHNEWDANQTLNDIALIRLSEKIDTKIHNQSIEPICLTKNDTNLLKMGTKCYATGWGAVWAKFNETNFEVGPFSRILKSVMVPIYDTKLCQNIHLNKSLEAIVDLNSEICAGGSAHGGSGVCFSDSGGPLQCQTSDNKWYQIGIISWTYRCAAPGVPDVYTRVSKYYEWIENTIKNSTKFM